MEGGTYQCPFCKNQILKINQAIHEVRCERDYKNMPQQTYPNQQQQQQQFQNNIRSSSQQDNNVLTSNKQTFIKDDLRNKPKLISCPKCGKTVEEQKLTIHRESDCLENLIPCEFCGQSFPLQFFQSHMDMCTKNPNNQGVSNENIKIPCEYCGKEMNGAIYEKHAAECRTKSQDPSRHIPEDTRQAKRQNIQEPGPNMFSQPTQTQGSRSYFQSQPQFFQQTQNMNQGNQFQQNPMNDMFSRMFSINFMNPQPSPNMQSQSQQQQQQGSFSSMGGPINITRTVINPDGRRITTTQTFNGGPGLRTFSFGGPGGFSMMSQGQSNQMEQEGDPFFNLLGGLFSSSFMGQPINFEDLLQHLGPRERGLDKETLNSFAVTKFDKEKSKNLEPELKKCAICMSEFEDGEEIKFLLCTHRFHTECINPWLEKHTTCPICKKDYSQLLGDHNIPPEHQC